MLEYGYRERKGDFFKMDISNSTATIVEDYMNSTNNHEFVLDECLTVGWFKNSLMLTHLLNEKVLYAKNMRETDRIFSIKDIFDEYLDGNRQVDFYDEYNGNRRREPISEGKFEWELHKNQIYDQLESTFKASNYFAKKLGIKESIPKFNPDNISAKAIPNLIFYLKEFYHPAMKAIRTKKYAGVTEQDWHDFSEKSKVYLLEQSSNRNFRYTELAAEATLNDTYFQGTVNLATEVAELILDDLQNIEQHENLLLKWKVKEIYEKNLLKAIDSSREVTTELLKMTSELQINLLDKLQDEHVEETIHDIYMGENLATKCTAELERIRDGNKKNSESLDPNLKKMLFKKLMKIKESRLNVNT